MPGASVVDVAGRYISYQSDTAEPYRHLEWFFGSASHDGPMPELEVCVGGSDPPMLPSSQPDWRRGPVERWHRDHDVLIRHESGSVARVTDARFEVELGPAVENQWRALRHILYTGLAWWFERRDLVLVHGAMIARGGDAALVLGDTGAGKSSLAFAALMAGWDLCSDDLVVVDTQATSVRLCGVPKRPAIDASAAERLGMPVDVVPDDDRRRVMLPQSALSAGWRQLRLLVVVGHHDDLGSITIIPHARALDAVINSYLEANRPGAIRRQLARLSGIAGSPAYELLHAAPVADRHIRAAELLGSAWDMSDPGPRQ